MDISKYSDALVAHLANKVTLKEPASLYEPIDYILTLGGKRLRPVLTLMSADFFGGNYKQALDASLAVEMFQTNDDQIIVNEVAPRPHNSGHYSIEASYTNQFEQHIRAILDLPLGNTASKVGGIMVNLVGEQNHTGDVAYQNIEEIMAMDGVTPHIYGKKQTRPFRKMGHVTIVNQNIDTAREIAQQVKQRIKVISK